MAASHREEAERLGVDEEERSRWQAAAEAMYVPDDAELGVHPQAELFTHYAVWDFEGTGPDLLNDGLALLNRRLIEDLVGGGRTGRGDDGR